jgi:hypothetical protein
MTHGLSKTFTFVIYFILFWSKWIKYTKQARWIRQDYGCKEEDEHNQTNPIEPWVQGPVVGPYLHVVVVVTIYPLAHR